MPEQVKKNVVLEMNQDKFHCLKKTIEGVESTVRMLGIHDGFKNSMVSDLKAISNMLASSQKKG